jgi:hypothetical protein
MRISLHHCMAHLAAMTRILSLTSLAAALGSCLVAGVPGSRGRDVSA